MARHNRIIMPFSKVCVVNHHVVRFNGMHGTVLGKVAEAFCLWRVWINSEPGGKCGPLVEGSRKNELVCVGCGWKTSNPDKFPPKYESGEVLKFQRRFGGPPALLSGEDRMDMFVSCARQNGYFKFEDGVYVPWYLFRSASTTKSPAKIVSFFWVYEEKNP